MAAKGKTPQSIYQMLLWLHGLGQEAKTKLEQYIETTLCSQLKDKFKSQSNVSRAISRVTTEAKKLVQKVSQEAGQILVTIQNGKDYNEQQNKGELNNALNELQQEAEGKAFAYARTIQDVFNCFVYCLTACYWQMRFLYLKCYTQSGVGGWGQCMYGKTVSENSDQCITGQHNQRCQECSSTYKGCLQAFITATQRSAGHTPSGANNIYKDAQYRGQCPQDTTEPQGAGTPSQCIIPPMGFQNEKLPDTIKQGIELYNALIVYFGNGNNKNFPKLLGHLLILELLGSSQPKALRVPPSWQLPHLFAFWSVFRQRWKGQGSTWKAKFNEELNGSGGGTGTQYQWKENPGKPYELLGNLLQQHTNADASHHKDNHNSLLTLTSCEVNNGASSNTHCGKYFHGLFEKPFEYVVGEFNKGKLFEPFMNHETIKNFAKQFYEKFREFKEQLEKQPCVQENSQCTCIVHCDDTHSCMYQNGLTFFSPASLAVKNKHGQEDTNRKDAPQRKCLDLNTQLEHVLKEDAPLYKLTRIWKILSPGTVHNRDNHNHGVDRIKELFKDVLKQLIKVTAKAAAAGVISTARFLNAHHSSLLEPPCNVKECIDWLIRVGELDTRTIENKKIAPSYKNGLLTRHCMVHVSAGPLQKNCSALAEALQALTGSSLIKDSDIVNLISSLVTFIGYNNGEVNGSGIATASYYSAYRMSATWPVCGQGRKCYCCQKKGNSCNCTASASCDGQCCDTCDVRTCTRIFLLIVPVLRNVLMYLYNKCKKGGKWASQTLNGTNGNKKNNGTELKNFMISCGFQTDKLNDKTGFTLAEQQEGTLTLLGGALNIVHTGIHKALQHKNESSKKFLRDGNKNGSGPKTIADMCLWLYFLPYCTNYNKVLEEFKNNANKFNGIINNFSSQLEPTISELGNIFNVIEGSPRGGNSLFQRIATLCKGEHIFKYPEPNKLIKHLALYVYKVHTQLRFLMVMCNTDKDKGGWKECEYTGNGQQTSVVQPSDYGSLTCQCGGSSGPGSSVPAAVTCPLLLRAFLTNGNGGKGQGQNGNVFKLYQNASGDKEEHLQMAFSVFSSTTTPAQGSLPTLTGKYIYSFLKDIVDDIPTPPAQSSPSPTTPSKKPLSLLTQYFVAIGQLHPQCLGDLFAFFSYLGQKWQSLTLYNNAGVFKEKLTVELNDYQIGTEGTDKSCGELQKKIIALFSTHNTHDIKDLMSLMCTNGHTKNDNCSPYMKSLSQGVYHYYCPEITGAGDTSRFGVLQYLYDMLRKLLDKMKELQKAFKDCECCQPGTSKNCEGLISCPYAHPILYKFGFVFGEPGSLSKKCTDIKAQLGVVLQCEKDQESVLFSAFECVIQVTYKVLLEKALKKVEQAKSGWNEVKSAEETKNAFTLYVENAMYISYPKLICTFACKLFNGEHDCNTNKCSDFKPPGPKPRELSTPTTLQVSSTAVTSITPIIPQYTAPPIDRYHYKTFNKQSGAQAKVEQKTENTYGFRDAIDFNIQGARCILPVPSNLRSAVDWILRVTVGVAKEGQENISKLSDAVETVLKESGVTVTDTDSEKVQQHIVSLVKGLCKFMGYQDKSKEVKDGVSKELGTNGKNGHHGVKGALKEKIEKIHGYLNGKDQVGLELGKALLKGRYDMKREDAVGALFDTANALYNLFEGVVRGEPKRGRTFFDIVTLLTKAMQSEHSKCDSDLKCNTIKQAKYSGTGFKDTSTAGSSLPCGLKELCDFFQGVKLFSCDGEKYRNAHVICTVIPSAKNKIEHHSSTNDKLGQGFFDKFFRALSKLGHCAQMVSGFKTNDYLRSSTQVRKKLVTLIKALKPATENINEDEVKIISAACDVYMRVIHKESQCFIVQSIKQNIELECYEFQKDRIVVNKLLAKMHTVVSSRMDAFKSHLDDLKALCQWLYRMSQLYANGLKGFVESLVKHLDHIVQVIKWIEEMKMYVNLLQQIPSLETDQGRQSIFFVNKCINNLLISYVLHELPEGNGQKEQDKKKVEQRHTLLRELRLLALDRYTLQVWQDNKDHIKDWITFEGGIVRHSNFTEIKQRLSDLTGIDYNSNTASSSAPTSAAQRIHDFHAICVIQKFSYEAPIAKLERSLKELNKIQGQLSEVKKKCENGSTSDVSNVQDDTDVKKFCTAVTEFLSDQYGIYSLAKFVHTILGPNVFSAVIGALEELTTDKLNKLNGDNGKGEKKAKFCGIIKAMFEGLASDTANKEHYTLTYICEKLEAFISTLKKEYIFAYPVVCGIECDKDCNAVCPGEPKGECCVQCSVQCSVKSKETSLACSSQSSVTPSLTSATSTVSLTSPLPSLCVHCHLNASICPQCIPLLARMFITLVPVLYPQLCYFAYQCRYYWCEQRINKDCNPLSSLLRTFGWPRECLSDSYIGIDVRAHGGFVSWLLSKDTNSLQLLCDNFTEEYNVSPFNEASPFHRLYNKCVSYYQQRKNERLTDSKSTTPMMPKTLRQILRFFVYLPFSAQFQSLQEVLRSYCSQSCVVNFSDTIATLMMSSAMSAVLLQLIECPQGAFLRFFDDIYTNKEGLYLDNNTETLFYQLCDLSVTLYRGLKYLSLQCSAERSLAGWKDCRLRGVKRNTQSEDTDRKDTSQALDTQQLQLCASHLCQCPATGATDSSTTAPMCLNSDSSATTPASHTTGCSFPLLRYLTDADGFFGVSATIPSALRKVCLNDSCQEMIYRHMAPRGWQKERLQCAHREGHSRDCDLKACSSVCHLKDSDPNCSDYSNCGVSCSHPCCRAQCCAATCSTLYGHHLFHLLRNFVGHEHDADPLLQFTRYMVAIAAWPPDSFSGYMTFMLRFSDQLGKQKNTVSGSLAHGSATQENSLSSSVLSSLKSEITLFPGEFNPQCLIDAFVRVTRCDHSNGAASSSSGTPVPPAATAASCDTTIVSQSSLSTSSGTTISVLRDCKDCKCIIYPLDYEIYDLYLPMYARRYLTWMLHFGPRLQRGLRALEKAFERHIGDSASQSRTSVECHVSVLRCPFALPELHAAGLHFWDRKAMCNVSCQSLVERLQCSIQDFSLLSEFLSACETFLWSVRKPFYWLTMALWIIATVYLLFVHFWRLDSWRLLSHVIRSRASHLVYPKVLLAAEHSYERYYAQR